MTKQFRIESKAGVVWGTYAADSKQEAFAAMVEETGGGLDSDGNPTEGTADDWLIYELDQPTEIATHRVNAAGLAYIAEQATELTGLAHTADSPAVAAYASAAESSADDNGIRGAQFEIRQFKTLSRRPEIVRLGAEHLDVVVTQDE